MARSLTMGIVTDLRLLELAELSSEERLKCLQDEVNLPELPLKKISNTALLIFLSMAAIGEFSPLKGGTASQFEAFVRAMEPVESFYDSIGGIIGYHLQFKRLLQGEKSSHKKVAPAPVVEMVEEMVNPTCLSQMAAIFPVGGAGDRLSLMGEDGEALPAACLSFGGETLLEGLFRDLEALEQLNGGEEIPVALMTSQEKNNDAHIRAILEKNHWFGRRHIQIFQQPLAPVITKEGRWSFRDVCELNMKPGGHGVMWKLAKDAGVFETWHKLGKTKFFVRQVNNPVAGTDFGLLAFISEGCRRNVDFGFMGCEQLLGAKEGVLALVDGHITNIEYTEFERWNLPSTSPSNINILFGDIDAIIKAVDENPLPGCLINLKKTSPSIDDAGKVRDVIAGRLETSMQNIADRIPVERVFVGAAPRRKIISVTKNLKGDQETPESAYLDCQKNALELLQSCGFTVSNCRFVYTPLLGPLYSLIQAKLRGGNITDGSELVIECPNVEIENLTLDGSLVITGKGRVVLRNLTVKNAGMESASWNGEVVRYGCRVIHADEGEEIVVENTELS